MPRSAARPAPGRWPPVKIHGRAGGPARARWSAACTCEVRRAKVARVSTSHGPPAYPILLNLRGRRVLVVGGGPVAARRAGSLARAGARVEVVAPAGCEALLDLVTTGDVGWQRRRYRPDDLAGAWLVQTATGDPQVDAAVLADAETAGVWAVDAGDAGRSAAWVPAVAYGEGGVLVAVGGGRDPGRARALRDAVQHQLDAGELPVRRVRRRPGTGRVYLVGGGPGDPDLLTVRARRLLAAADVVVTDRLAPQAISALLTAGAEVVDVGKAPDRHPMPQQEINALLVARARDGDLVVRLKGGDPFVLGRGGEEAWACAAAGVPVEVVPGVTSAVAVPAAAGIPVTHRGITTSFLVASAHEGVSGLLEQVTAAAAETTLVLLMGVRRLPEVARGLLAQGRPPQTPAAVVSHGWTPQQRTVVGTLGDIATLAADAGLGSPSVVVVGDVVALRAQWGDLGTPSPAAGHNPAVAADAPSPR
ncbi:MAG: uroporphyrinogen-III C-methyltransferase [Actinomycetota bacterium]|nr:MAG: uroporphyrinogen-III C-methyltransferase [Actinomycetota bacterium]